MDKNKGKVRCECSCTRFIVERNLREYYETSLIEFEGEDMFEYTVDDSYDADYEDCVFLSKFTCANCKKQYTEEELDGRSRDLAILDKGGTLDE